MKKNVFVYKNVIFFTKIEENISAFHNLRPKKRHLCRVFHSFPPNNHQQGQALQLGHCPIYSCYLTRSRRATFRSCDMSINCISLKKLGY